MALTYVKDFIISGFDVKIYIKLSLSSVGRRLSNETKVKISNTKKGVKNGPPSEDTK